MIVSSQSIDIILDRRSTDDQSLEKERMTVMELGDSTRKRRMSMESTEMITDMPEM